MSKARQEASRRSDDGGAGSGQGSQARVETSPGMIIACCVIVLYFVCRFSLSHVTWFHPFVGDLGAWLAHPTVAGGPHASRWVLAAIVVGLAGVTGSIAAGFLLSGTRYSAERSVRTGLAIVIGIAALGYAGMLGLVLGMLTPFALFAFVIALGTSLWLWSRPLSEREEGGNAKPISALPSDGPRWRRILSWTVVIVVVGWMFLHALYTPVQEWDALVYHAESAKVWFEQRPEPPLLFGPSVGIQLSNNYPPLFPAAGAAIYTMIAQFEDLYLRILPPLLFLSITLMTFGFARRRFDEATASYAVLLLCGTPLLVMYGVWQTGYILTTALVLATLVLSDAAAESGRLARWGMAGGVAGLSILSHVYGFLALPVGAAAVVLAPRGTRMRAVAVFAGVAIAVASPWLLRNLFLLHDPLWPFASPPFQGRGLIEPFWSATQEEIRSNALGALGIGPGYPPGWVRLHGVRTALFHPALLPAGVYLPLAFAAVRARSERVVGAVGLGLAGMMLALLLPGWFWLRAILPALPLAVLLTARAAAVLLAAATEAIRTRRLVGRIAWLVASTTVTIAIAGGALLGVGIAIAGPNQDQWTITMSSDEDLMGAVKRFGSGERTLWNVFTGDVLLWRYMNDVIPDDVRVATIENRIYYLDEIDLFYLDGLEAAPLVEMRDPAAIERFFLQRQVGYIVIPNRLVTGPARFPIVDILPVFRLLGTDRFPTVAAFPVRGYELPSLIYRVGPATAPPTVGVFPGYGQLDPPSLDGIVTIPPGATDPRISVPLPPRAAATLRFRYEREGAGSFEINLYDPSRARWRYGIVRRDRPGTSGWGTVVVPLTDEGTYAQLGVSVEGDPLRIRDLEVVFHTDPTTALDSGP